MWTAYGYSRRLKGKPSALFPGGARLRCLMATLFYLPCSAINRAIARSNYVIFSETRRAIWPRVGTVL
jgi:hypothetical protein